LRPKFPAQTDQANANLQSADIDAARQCLAAAEGAGQDGECGGGRFRGHRRRTSTTHLNEMLEETVGRPCEEVIAGRLSIRPMPAPTMSPWPIFARLFSPGGVLDRFFAQNLASLCRHERQGLGTGNRTPSFGRIWRNRRSGTSSLRRKSARPSFRSVVRCRRSTSPSRRSRCTAMPTWRCSISMASVLQATQAGNTPGPDSVAGQDRLGQSQPERRSCRGRESRNQVRRPLGVETIAGQGARSPPMAKVSKRISSSADAMSPTRSRPGRTATHSTLPGAFRLQLSEGFLMGNCMAGSAIAGRRDSGDTTPSVNQRLRFRYSNGWPCGKLARHVRPDVAEGRQVNDAAFESYGVSH